MRVLYVHHRGEGGGAPKSLALLIEALGDDVDAHVLCPPGDAAALFARAGAQVHEGHPATFSHTWVGDYRGMRAALLGRDLGRLPAHARQFRGLLQALRPDVVHLNEAVLVPAARMTRVAGVPLVWHLRAASPADGRRASRAMRRWVGTWPDAALAINEDVAASYGGTPRVVFNPVPLPPASSPEAAAGRRALGIDPELPAVGMVSNLYSHKGWEPLLLAMGSLNRDGVAAQVVLAGSTIRSSSWFGSRRNRLLARVAGIEDTPARIAAVAGEQGLQGRVHVLGSRDDVAAVYDALDVVCFPSRGPEIGRPVLEGQAHGKPVVVTGTRTGGGVIDNGVTGLVVGRDVPALSAALGRLLAEPALAAEIGLQARRHATLAYAPEKIASQVLDVYRTVTAR